MNIEKTGREKKRRHLRVIGANIIKFREKKGWDQSTLCKYSGISQAGLNQIERRYRNPTADTLIKISEALGVSTDEILGIGATVPENMASPDTIELIKLLNKLSVQERRAVIQLATIFAENIDILKQGP